MKVLAKFFDIFKRSVEFDKKHEIYANGSDNAYPELTDRLINNSVTAKSAANIMVQYLLGKGYGKEVDSFVVNKEKKLTLIDFADDLADDLVKQRGAFIHVNYNALFEVSSISLLPYEWCRIGKKDSKDYNGKIAVYKHWCETKKKESEPMLIDVFNNDKNIIEKQVETAGGWDEYKGQILFVNMDTKLIYPLSRIDSVSNDCDSEAQASVYKNRTLRRGFFGNTLVVTRPLSDNQPLGENASAEEIAHRRKEESEREAFQESIEKSLGAENTGGVLCIEMDFAGEKLEDAILIKQIESKIDDKMFNYTETSVRENILVAFNNLPAGLVKTSDSSLFGNSGEAIMEMKKTYWENTTKERNLLTSVLNKLLILMKDAPKVVLEPIKLIEDANINNQRGNPTV